PTHSARSWSSERVLDRQFGRAGSEVWRTGEASRPELVDPWVLRGRSAGVPSFAAHSGLSSTRHARTTTRSTRTLSPTRRTGEPTRPLGRGEGPSHAPPPRELPQVRTDA